MSLVPAIILMNLLFVVLGIALSPRNIFTPIVVFHSIWTIIFILYSLREIFFPVVDLGMLNHDASIFYLIIFMCYFAGAILALFISRFLSKKQIFPSTLNSNQRVIVDNYLVKLVSIISLIMAFIAIQKNEFSILQYITSGDLIRAAVTLDYNPTKNIWTLLASYASFLALPFCVILLIDGERKLWLFYPYISIIIISFLSLGKYNILIMLAITLNIWFLKRKFSFKNIMYILRYLVGVLGVVALLFIGSAYLRNNISDEVDYQNKSFPITFLLYMYSVGHVGNFGAYLATYDPITGSSETANAGFRNINVSDNNRFGEKTFSGAYRLAYWLGLKSQVTYTRYEGRKNFNTYSILRNYVDDFGYRGSWIAMFVTGFFLQLLYVMAPKSKPSGIILLSIIFCFIEFTIIHSIFNFIFVYLMILVSPYLHRFTFKTTSGSGAL